MKSATAEPLSYTYYLLNPKFETGVLQVMSLSDANAITVGSSSLELGRNERAAVAAGPNLASGAKIQGTGPFSVSSDVNATDLPVPGSFIGTRFVIPHNRNDHTYYILSPYADAQVTVTLSGASTIVSALQGKVLTFDAGSINGISGLVQSNQPILVSHAAYGGLRDAYPVPPVAKELWGVLSNAATIGALEDATTVSVYGSTGASETFTLDAGGFHNLTIPGGAEGVGSGVHVVADKPIAGIQIADSDGTEATAFLDTPYLATRYAIPLNAQYIAVVCPEAGTVVSLYTGSNSSVDKPCEGNGTVPGKVYFGSAADGINIAAGARLQSSRPIYAYFEASATNDEHNTLGYMESYYVLNSRTQTAAMSVMSLIDGNRITAGTTEILLDRNERAVVPAGSDLAPTTEITGSGPFTLGSDYNGTDLPVPGVFAGIQFVIPHHRYTHTYALLSPYGDASVEVSLGGAVPSTVQLQQGQLVEFNAGNNASISGLLKADRPILVVHKGNASADVFPVPPAATDLWGILSNTAVVGALDDNTVLTVYASNGQSSVYTLSKGQKMTIGIGKAGSQGQGSAIHIVADKPVAAYQNADSDGAESTAFLSMPYLGTHYGIPVDAQYVAVVCTEANTTITLTEGAVSRQKTCSGSTTYPGKAYFGNSTAGANISAGAVLSATQPVYVIYEASASNDEHNLLGYKIGNQAPVAVAGGPYSGEVAGQIAFDGSGSSDLNGDPLTYSWNFGDGSVPGVGVSPSHVYSAAGTYTVTLTVNDGREESLPATATVVVANVNKSPVANAGGPYSGLVDGAISFNGLASSDPDGDPLSYSWDFGDGSAPGTGESPSHIYAAAGSYTVSLVVNDGAVNSVPSTAVVIVSALNPPSITGGGALQYVQQDSYTVTGVAQPGQLVRLYANDSLVATPTADDQGNYQAVIGLQSGLNSIYTTVVSGGVESRASNLRSVFKDVSLPGQAVGSLAGNSRVTESGAATYSVPIEIPPGITGVQPSVSLEYSSQSGNGLLGVGWSLGGMSAISRCPATLAQDGFTDGVDFDSNDRFCMDGQRLVEIANSGCSGGREYRSEIDSYSRVCSFGLQGSGPRYFIVETKTGQTLEYGNSTSSRIEAQGRTDVYVWAINKTTDAVGNYVTYSYTEDNAAGHYRPARIDYTGNQNTGKAPFASIRFSYAARTDIRKGYVSGSLLSTPKLLTNVKTFVNDAWVFDYQISYGTSAETSRSRITSITKCSRTDGCLPASQFSWRAVPSGGWSNQSTQFAPLPYIANNAAGNGAQDNGVRLIDLNGDGLLDMIQHAWWSGSNIQKGAWINTGNGWQSSPAYVPPPAIANNGGQDNGVRLVDLNGDGLLDMIQRVWWSGSNTQQGAWINTGSGWQSAPAFTPPAYITNNAAGKGVQDNGVRLVDLNGDGLLDMIQRVWWSGSNIQQGAWINTGSGWQSAPAFTPPAHIANNAAGNGAQDNGVRLVDLNADGLLDMIQRVWWSGSNIQQGAWINTGSGWQSTPAFTPPAYIMNNAAGRGSQDNGVRLVDLNGDGLLDMVQHVWWSGSNIQKGAWINTGAGWLASPSYTPAPYIANNATNQGAFSNGVEFIDLNGDGLLDMMQHVWWSGSNIQKGSWINTGNGWQATSAYIPSLAIANNASNQGAMGNGAELADLNGDGLQDIVQNVWWSSSNIQKGAWINSTGIPDLLARIDNNGLGTQTSFSYQPLTNDAIYTRRSDATFPVQDLQLPMYVASAVSSSDGLGGLSTSSYYYEGLKSHLQRGSLGFSKISVTNNVTNIVSSSVYNQAFPLTGRIASSDTRIVGASSPLSTTSFSWNASALTGLYGVARYEVLEASNVEEAYELDGRKIKTVTTAYDLYGSNGNIRKMTVTSRGGNPELVFSKTTVNEYAQENTANWIIGRVTRATVTSTTPYGSESRMSAFEYRADGLLSAEIVEPLQTELMLRTDYGYDSYGNKTSETVSDSGASATYPIQTSPSNASTSVYNYANLVNGNYTVTSSNRLGHTETRVVDARFGVVSYLVGPNGLATSWTYDGFGRKLDELRADGTSSVWTYDWCNTECPTLGRYSVSKYISGAPKVTEYFDALERKLRSETTGLNGRTIRNDTQYNNRGQTVAISRNYFAGDVRYFTTSAYDDLGRITRVTSPDGGVVETSYAGLTTTIRKFDPNGDYDQSTTQVKNVIGEEIQVIDEASQSLFKSYDPFGNLLQTRDPSGNVTTLSYDKRGHKIAMKDPDTGYWQYAYDALGQLRWQKDAKNQVTTMNYDVLGRMVQRDEAEGRTTWVYDTASGGVGKLASIITPDFRRSLSYDRFGRLSADNRTVGLESLVTSTRFDAFGRTDRLTYPSGFRVAYSYNGNGYQTRVYNAANAGDIFWEATDSDADGNVVTYSMAGLIRTDRLYDPASGRLKSIVTGENVQLLDYTYDSLGNLRQRVDQYRGLTETFSYDTRNRLIGSVIGGVGSKSYSYDNLGNITRKGAVSDYTYGGGSAGPHAVTFANGQNYSYDANGNMVSGAGRTVQWTSYNKPILINKGDTTLTFDYGPGRSRYRQISNNAGVITTTLYFDKLYEQVSKDGSTERKHYINAGGTTVAIYNQFDNGSENLRYLHKDHLGSTDVITDELGNIVEQHSFDAFGSRRNVNWSDATSVLSSLETTRGFTGHEQLDDVGLVHMNGRVYDPILGRFISADPQVQFAGNLQSYNRYSYVHNNPLSATDPSGFGIFKKIKKAFKKVFQNPYVRLAAGLAAAAILGPVSYSYVGLLTSSPAIGAVAGGFVGGFAVGGITSRSLKGAVIGGLQGAAFAVAGHAPFLQGVRSFGGGLGKPLLHGAVGGGLSKATGGGFREGFASGFVTKFTNQNFFTETKDTILKTVRSAVAGGLSAEVSGGKFTNGAQTGAFSYLFNDAAGRFGQFVKSGIDVVSRALTVVGGGGQVLLGGALCSTVAGCVFGAPVATLGASNIQEGITGQDGFARDGFQALFGENAGDLAFGAVNLGTSVTGLGRAVLKQGVRPLFRTIPSDFEPAFRQATGAGLAVEGATSASGVIDTIDRTR